MDNVQEKITQAKEFLKAGDEKRTAAQHAAGKNTARERVAQLFDAGSFMEIETLRKDANVVAGFGTVHGRAVYCFAQDYTSCGGAMTRAQAEKVKKLLNMAQMTGAPVVAMVDSAGVKVTEGAAALPAYAEIFSAMTRLSGVCPMVCCVMGPCTGIATLMTQVCDVTVQVEKIGTVQLHGASVMNSDIANIKTEEALFGAAAMAKQGAVALTCQNEAEAVLAVQSVLDALPGCNQEDAPLMESDDLNRVMTASDAADAASVIADFADGGKTVELYKEYGKAAHTVLCHVGGHSVGLVVTDYAVDSGRLDADTCQKIARFVRMCDCYQLPVVTLVNTDGIAVPCACGQAKAMRAAAQMLYAYAEATAPKVAVVTGNAVGAAYVSMGGKAIADVCYAWPTAMVSPVTKQVAVAAFENEKLNAGESREKLEEEYTVKTGALHAAENALVDEVIDPQDTRKVVINALEFLYSKRDVNLPKKHGNMPL